MNPDKGKLRELDLQAQLDVGVDDVAVSVDEQVCVDTGLLIRRLRQKNGLTQEILASRVGMPQPYLSDLERGKSKQGPTLTTLMRIAKACGESLLVVPESELGQLSQVKQLTKRQSKRLSLAPGLRVGQIVTVEDVAGGAPRGMTIRKLKTGQSGFIEIDGDVPGAVGSGGGIRKRYSGAGGIVGSAKRSK